METEEVELKGVSRRKGEEVACRRVIERFGLLGRPLGTTGLEGDITTFFNHDNGAREDVNALLALEMSTRGSREGRDERANHTCKERQKLGICPIIAVDESSLEGRLVGKRAKRMYIREKVIHERLEDGPGRDGLSIKADAGLVSSN